MRKLGLFIFGALFSFALVIFSGFPAFRASADSNTVYIGGMPAGFTLQSGCPQIVGLCEVVTENGTRSPALDAGLKVNDRIVSINGTAIETVDELNKSINKTQGKSVKAEILRGEEEMQMEISPANDKITGTYKIGVLVRDSVSGIGTVTFINPTTKRFGALGHPVSGENNKTLKISKGEVYPCSIISVYKGTRGKAGELRGMFLSEKILGTADKLCSSGIFGQISNSFKPVGLDCAVADSSSVTPGNAYIYTTVNGLERKRYEIEIVKVDKNQKDNKNYVIKITDEDLISQTGGIVQGMSGSPILQNGKLIGAVTHVFLNDPTRGYGIDIHTMLNEK